MQIAYIPREEETHEAAPTEQQQEVQTDIAERTRELVEQYQDRQAADANLEAQVLPPPDPFTGAAQSPEVSDPLPFASEMAQVAPVMPGSLPGSGSGGLFLILIVAMVGIGIFGGKILSKL